MPALFMMLALFACCMQAAVWYGTLLASNVALAASHCQPTVKKCLSSYCMCSSACICTLHFRLSRCQERCLECVLLLLLFRWLGSFPFSSYLLVSSPTSSMPSMSSFHSPLSCHFCKRVSLITNMRLHHFLTVWVVCSFACCSKPVVTTSAMTVRQ